MSKTMLRRTTNGAVEEVLVMVWDGVRIQRGAPSPDGPQGSFERISLHGAAANAEAARRIAALKAEGFVTFEPQKEEETKAAAPKRALALSREAPAPSKPRRVTAPDWLAKLPPAAARQLAAIKKTIAKAGLTHRGAEIEATARVGITFSVRKAKPADLKKVVSRIGGHPDLPPATQWPTVRRAPLTFVAQVVLADVKALDLERALPSTGVLSFFAQLDATRPDYCELAHVAHFPASKLARTAAPEGVVRIAPGLLTPKLRMTLSPCDEPAIAGLRLNDKEAAAYHDEVFLASIPKGRHHVLSGWGTAGSHHGIRGARFLAQIDSDHRIALEMGDSETLRFYVRGDALSDAAFTSAVCTTSEL